VKLTQDDMRRLRLPMAATALLVLLGAACVTASDHYLGEVKNAREAARVQREQAQKRVAQVAEEEREIQENLVHYRRMVERGMAAQENRLDVIDVIARIKNDRRLFEIRYNIEPQKPLQYDGIVRSTPVDLVASRLKLEMLLLHEEDLLNFISDLEASRKGFVSVRSCIVSRIDRGTAPTPTVVPRLRSECEVDLVALKQVKPA